VWARYVREQMSFKCSMEGENGWSEKQSRVWGSFKIVGAARVKKRKHVVNGF